MSMTRIQLDEDGDVDFVAQFNNKKVALKTMKLELTAVTRENDHLRSQIQSLQRDKGELSQRLVKMKEATQAATKLQTEYLEKQQVSLNELKMDQQQTAVLVETAKSSLDELKKSRKDSTQALQKLAILPLLEEGGTLAPAEETRTIIAELQEEYKQCGKLITVRAAQEVIKMLKEKLTFVGGDLIESKSRIRELEADCIRDKQSLKESVQTLLISSQQIAETSLLLRKQQEESLQALVCAADAEGQLSAAQKQITELLGCLETDRKKLESLQAIEEQNMDLISQLRGKQLEAATLEHKVSSLDQTLLNAREFTQEQKCKIQVLQNTIEFQEQKIRDKEDEEEDLNTTLEKLRISESQANLSAEQLRSERDGIAQRFGTLEHEVSVARIRIESFNERLGQADTRFQLLQERFDEQSLTLRITKEANGDLDVSLNDLKNQLKEVQDSNSAVIGKYQVDSAVACEKIASLTEQLECRRVEYQLRLDSDKHLLDQCQLELVVVQEKNIALVDQLGALKVEFQSQRDSNKDVQADLRIQLAQQSLDKQETIGLMKEKVASTERMLDDAKNVEEELRVQLSLRDSEPTVPLAMHQSTVEAQEALIKEQEAKISDLNRRATTIASRHKKGQLVIYTGLVSFHIEPEATFVQSLIKKTQALHEEKLVTKDNELCRITNINKQLESKIETMQVEMARLLIFQDQVSERRTKSIMDVNTLMPKSSPLSDAPNIEVDEISTDLKRPAPSNGAAALAPRNPATLTTRQPKNAGASTSRRTFATMEEDSEDDIVEDNLEPPKLGKRDRNAVEEAPRTRQQWSTKKPEIQNLKASHLRRALLLLRLAALSMSVTVPLNQLKTEQSVLNRPTTHGPAHLPVPNPSKSFWVDSSPDPSPLRLEGSSGDLTDEADVCIIGSGITGNIKTAGWSLRVASYLNHGVGVAHHLSQAVATSRIKAGLKVVILEAREFCSGATGRNGGHLTPATFKHFQGLQEMHGTKQALRALALEDYTVSSLLKIIDTEGLADKINLAAWGHNYLLLSETEVAEARADLKAAQAAGVDLYGTPHPGFRFPGHNLWPLKLVTQLYLLAKSRTPDFSLSIHTRTPVTSIFAADSTSNLEFGRRYTLDTPRGLIKCSYIVHATNAHASHLLPQFTGPNGIIPTRGQAMALGAAVTREELGTSGWGGNEGFEYWFPMPASVDMPEANPITILGGGREVATPQFELYEEDDSSLNEDVSRALIDFLPNLFKGRYEKGRKPDMEWSGIMAMTKIHDPFVGPVLDPKGGKELYQGQFISAGYSGHGMPRAFACAEVIADMIVSEISGTEWSLPDWLPEQYLTWNRLVETENME
ncbi:hypothetical protein HWV62_476 [Athelia sp. TMB]|nr:hypothetical protein HWV62_476 [Athelia sp. TMB]